jgi:hypothetical protein
MKSPGESIRHAKARGEWAELRFITRALELKFRVSKPWGDSAPYDLVTDHRGRFRRVQVKCTIFHRGNSYKCHLDSNGLPYSPRDIDFIAAYVSPPRRGTSCQSNQPKDNQTSFSRHIPKTQNTKNTKKPGTC